MKAVRAQRHDVDVIEEMHEAQPFDLDTLVERFDNEIGQAMIDPRQFELQFLYIVERTLWREERATCRRKRTTEDDKARFRKL